MRYQEVKSDCWYLLAGRFYYVRKVVPEGIIFSPNEQSSHTWLKTGRQAVYFTLNAAKTSIEEVKEFKGRLEGNKKANYDLGS